MDIYAYYNIGAKRIFGCCSSATTCCVSWSKFLNPTCFDFLICKMETIINSCHMVVILELAKYMKNN